MTRNEIPGDSPAAEQRTEQRTESRYICAGRAGIARPPNQREEPGTILDLSMNGCRVRLNQAVPLAVGSNVEINLQSDYLSFRAIASVRHCGEGGTVLGLLFKKLTAAGRHDLRCLIEDLEAE